MRDRMKKTKAWMFIAGCLNLIEVVLNAEGGLYNASCIYALDCSPRFPALRH